MSGKMGGRGIWGVEKDSRTIHRRNNGRRIAAKNELPTGSLTLVQKYDSVPYRPCIEATSEYDRGNLVKSQDSTPVM